jgi:hypothetical protein
MLNISVDIEDVHVPRILIFNIWENYRFLNLNIFEKWEYIFYIWYIICPPNYSHMQFWSKDPFILLNASMDIDDVHMTRILIFINIGENYRL